jgi:DNA gyrase subunit A
LFFTSKGQVHWLKVHKLPQLARESRGRAIVNLISLDKDETVAACRAIRDFTAEDHYLVMCTSKGLVKKTELSKYGRPRSGGIIAIKLRDDDKLIDAIVTQKDDELVLCTADGMAIRFAESDARPMGRNTSGVKGITISGDDEVVGMRVADPNATLLTVCEKGYGKRTPFGPNIGDVGEDGDEASSSARYRTQKRGGKGLRDIKTTERNGKVIGICSVNDDDELLLMTARGKIQRIKCSEISVIGRNTQGVRIMRLKDDDTLATVVRVPRDELVEDETPATVEGKVVSKDSPEVPEEPKPEVDDQGNNTEGGSAEGGSTEGNDADGSDES